MTEADKSILDLLATLEFEAEFNSDNEDGEIADEDIRDSSARVTTLKRLIREAGYSLPQHFNWMHHFQEDSP